MYGQYTHFSFQKVNNSFTLPGRLTLTKYVTQLTLTKYVTQLTLTQYVTRFFPELDVLPFKLSNVIK